MVAVDVPYRLRCYWRGSRLNAREPAMRIPTTLCTGLFLVGAVAVASPEPVSQTPAPSARGERKLRDVASPDVPLATILDRASEYVKHYSNTFRNVLAEEEYRQWLGGEEWGPSIRDMGIYRPRGGTPAYRDALAALRDRVGHRPRPSALGCLPRCRRAQRPEAQGPRGSPGEALREPAPHGARAGTQDPRGELALQPRGPSRREPADAGAGVALAREPAPPRVRAQGRAHDREPARHRGGVSRGREP